VLKKCLNLYTRNQKKEVKAMERKKQVPQMKQDTQQTTICFITFQCKVDRETARQIVAELRKRFPSQTLIFTARPPIGRKIITNINGILVVVTIPYSNRQEAHSQSSMQEQAPSQEGFTLRDLIKNKP